VPSIANCTAGTLSEIEKEKVLTYINSVRAKYNLPNVVYDNTKSILAQEAALIGAANANISNTIAESDFCYSANAAQEYLNGNRSLWGNATANWPTCEIHVNDWLADSTNITCRRRILDPFLKSITFGRIIGTPKKGEYKYVSSAILMTTPGNIDLSERDISYIAYPQGICDYKLFGPDSYLSFSVLYDKYNKSNNGASNIDFSGVTVNVSAGSQSLEIVSVYDYNNYGLPNNLQWKAAGLTKTLITLSKLITSWLRENLKITNIHLVLNSALPVRQLNYNCVIFKDLVTIYRE
jgi:hypothetical protein